LAFEQPTYSRNFTTGQPQPSSELYASLLSAVQLATQRIQVWLTVS